jgi:hypothetical protein
MVFAYMVITDVTATIPYGAGQALRTTGVSEEKEAWIGIPKGFDHVTYTKRIHIYIGYQPIDAPS